MLRAFLFGALAAIALEVAGVDVFTTGWWLAIGLLNVAHVMFGQDPR